MRISLAFLLGCVLLNAVGVTAAAAGQIVATHRLPNPVGGTFAIPLGSSAPGVQIAQTFTAQAGGFLEKVSVAAVSLDGDPTGLQLSLTTLVNGQPGAVVASAPLAGLHTNGQFADITALNAVADFSTAPIALQSNEQYALLFVSQRSLASFQVLGDQTVGTSRDYVGGIILRSAGGNPFQLLPGGDLVFVVTVVAIPEPSAFGLYLSGIAATWGWRRRQTSQRG